MNIESSFLNWVSRSYFGGPLSRSPLLVVFFLWASLIVMALFAITLPAYLEPVSNLEDLRYVSGNLSRVDRYKNKTILVIRANGKEVLLRGYMDKLQRNMLSPVGGEISVRWKDSFLDRTYKQVLYEGRIVKHFNSKPEHDAKKFIGPIALFSGVWTFLLFLIPFLKKILKVCRC